MFNNLSFGECIGIFLGLGVLLRLGSLLADSWLSSMKWLFHDLKVHFQKPSK
mgnify:CR=1 FL=1